MKGLKHIRHACRITDRVFDELVSNFDFSTERDVEKFVLRRFRDLGAGYSYRSIVANNTSVIHAIPRDQELERGFLVLDIGARVNGWCSDMTRTIFLGKPHAEERALYDLVLKCQQACVRRIKPGVACKELDLHARKLLGRYKKYFPHALGHGVGWRVHQNPRISPKSKAVLQKGDVITIEPGIYLNRGGREFGIRVEDTLLVTREGYESLNTSTRKLIAISGY